MAKKSKKVVAKKVAEEKVDGPVVQEWVEPYPTEGLVRVQLLEDHGISEVTDGRGRMKMHSKGSVIVIDAAVAQGIHKSITGVA